MTLSFCLRATFLESGRRRTYRASVTNDYGVLFDQVLVDVWTEKEKIGEVEITELKPKEAKEFDIALEFKTPNFDEIETQSVTATLVASSKSLGVIEISFDLGSYVITPQYPPYVSRGLPSDRSFQGRDELYADVARFIFNSVEASMSLDAPYNFGKTSFVKKMPKRSEFSQVDIVVLDAGTKTGESADTQSVPKALAEKLAELVFRTSTEAAHPQSLPTFLLNLNTELRLKGRYILIAIDTLEAWLRSAETDESVLNCIRAVRGFIANSELRANDRIKWLYSGAWSLNPAWNRIWREELITARQYGTRHLRMLDSSSGRRVVVEPTAELFNFDDAAQQRIGDLTGWHPMLIQILCFTIYVQELEKLTQVPWNVGVDAVNESACNPLVTARVRDVWQRTLFYLAEAPIMLDVFRAIRSRSDEAASEIQIVNALAGLPELGTSNLSTVAAVIGHHNPHATTHTAQELMPGIISYLMNLGLLVEIEATPLKYRMSSELLAQYIAGLGSSSPKEQK